MKIANLIVKRSTLPGSGKGLFTKCLIPKNTKVAEYKGKITTWENADHDDGDNPYIYYVNKDHVIDAKNNKTSLAHYANDADGLKKVRKLDNNSTYAVENKRVFIKALTDIPAGSEILVGYGKEYWKVIKKNKESKTKKSALKK
ncbi:MAG: SET domain-containing protein [Ferruginibacter sp.]